MRHIEIDPDNNVFHNFVPPLKMGELYKNNEE